MADQRKREREQNCENNVLFETLKRRCGRRRTKNGGMEKRRDERSKERRYCVYFAAR